MNEMNISEKILETACAEAKRTGGRVVSLRVSVGSLSGCHIPSLKTWLEELSRGTAAEGCAMDLMAVEPLARCLGCSRVFAPESDGPACSCGSSVFSLISGQEAYLDSFVLEYPDAEAAEPPLGFGPADPDGHGYDVLPADG